MILKIGMSLKSIFLYKRLSCSWSRTGGGGRLVSVDSMTSLCSVTEIDPFSTPVESWSLSIGFAIVQKTFTTEEMEEVKDHPRTVS